MPIYGPLKFDLDLRDKLFGYLVCPHCETIYKTVWADQELTIPKDAKCGECDKPIVTIKLGV